MEAIPFPPNDEMAVIRTGLNNLLALDLFEIARHGLCQDLITEKDGSLLIGAHYIYQKVKVQYKSTEMLGNP